jgi:hypothetical protein
MECKIPGTRGNNFLHCNNCSQMEIDQHRNCILGDSWFASVKTAEAINECGHEWIGIVKTSHSLFPKKELEEKRKTWPGGMSLVMESATSKGVKLIAVRYKYNSSKVTSRGQMV